jgi:tetratricopeptide (TPR) repeat protein
MVPRKYHSDSSDTESFKSFDDNEPSPPRSPNATSRGENDTTQPPASVERFPPEEEATLLAESNSLKGAANQLFGKGSFENAIQTYDKALSSCPNYLDYEVAVLRSNVAACHLKLQEWKQAIDSAGKGLDCLERMEPLPSVRQSKPKDGDQEESEEVDAVEEVDEATEERIERLKQSRHTLDEVRRLQIKLLMRRAKGRTEQGGWAPLQGADEDYRTLLHPNLQPSLAPMDRRQVLESAQKLEPKLAAAKEKEMAEMMDKLKGLGNSILKPFGLSTNNFQFVKDEKTGGYSMNFNQSPGTS